MKLRNQKLKVKQGYGLALLLVFIMSTVLMGVSMQLLLGSSSTLGTKASDGMTQALQVARAAMPVVQKDIQNKLNSGLSVDTSYSLSGSINVPTDASNLSGTTASMGTYTASILKARGNSYLVSVTGTADGSSATYSELLLTSGITTLLDVVPNATAAYSLRRLRAAYTGTAIRVRRSSDNTEINIGFLSSGDLDVSTLQTFVGSYSPGAVLDSAGTALAAYSVRKLRSAYAGSAIRVRRSDNTQQNIGFLPSGELDVPSLLSFVGSSGNGYVTTWYDQSGNGYNATQPTGGSQPIIVSSGSLNTMNGRPALRYNGSSTSLATVALASLPSSASARTMNIVAQASGSGWYGGYSWGSSTSSAACGMMVGTQVGWHGYGVDTYGVVTSDQKPHLLTVTYDGTTVKGYQDTNSVFSTARSYNTSVSTPLQIGKTVDGHYVIGNESEIIIYSSAVSDTLRALLENNQKQYYLMGVGYVTTWYDQSGNTLDATQTTYMPLIMSAGTVSTIGGKPAVEFDGANSFLSTASSAILPSGAGSRSLNTVELTTGNAWFGAYSWGAATSGNACGLMVGTQIGIHGYGIDNYSTATVDTLPHVVSVIYDGTMIKAYLDTAPVYSGSRTLSTTASTSLLLGKTVDGHYMTGKESEILIYNRPLSLTERTAIESNQSVYY